MERKDLLQPLQVEEVARALRVLDGLRHEGETPVMVHWNLAEDLRALARARAALFLL